VALFNIEKLKDDPKLETAMSLLIAYATTKRAEGGGGARCMTILDECWALLQSPSLVRWSSSSSALHASVTLACGHQPGGGGFHRTPDKPNRIGAAILTTTAIRLIGRQKGNVEVLSEFLHLSAGCD